MTMNSTLDNVTDISSPTDEIEEYHSTISSKVSSVYQIFLELYTVLSLICIAANVLIIYVIIKYRRLRHEKANVIILNWAILNTFFMMTQPTTLRISLYWIDPIDSWSSTALCIVEQIEYTAINDNVLMIVILFIYWFLKVYHPRSSVKYSNNIYVSIGIVHLFCLFSLAIHVDSCINTRYFSLAEILLVLLYLIFILFMIIMNITHLIKRRKLIQTTVVSNTPLVLSNVFFLSVFPLLIVSILPLSFRVHPIIFIVMINIALILAVMNPIYFVIILNKSDKDFKTFFGYVFRCQCRKYGNDELVEEPVIYNGQVQVV